MPTLVSSSGALHALRNQCPHGARIQDAGLALLKSQVLHDRQKFLILVWLPGSCHHRAQVLKVVAVSIATAVRHATKLHANGCPLTLVFFIEHDELLIIALAPCTDVVLRVEHTADMQIDIEQWSVLEARGYLEEKE